MTKLDLRIKRKKRGTVTRFFPTINGKRINNTNFARKYDARALLRNVVKYYGEVKLIELTY